MRVRVSGVVLAHGPVYCSHRLTQATLRRGKAGFDRMGAELPPNRGDGVGVVCLYLRRFVGEGTADGFKVCAAKDIRKTRCTAYQFCRGLDHQLALAGTPLSTFRSDVGWGGGGGGGACTTPLAHGQKRVFLNTDIEFQEPGMSAASRCHRHRLAHTLRGATLRVVIAAAFDAVRRPRRQRVASLVFP